MAFADNQTSVIATEPYVLGAGESTLSVAKKLNITPDALQKLNQFRGFSKPFDHLSVGDEIDIPMASPIRSVKTTDAQAAKAESLTNKSSNPANFWQKDPNDPFYTDWPPFGATAQSAQSAQTEGSATGMARSAINGKINDAASQWLNQFGTARLQLNIDNDFHLDGSSLDMLLPLYNQPKDMLFTQLGVRNRDSRNTLNVGLGARTWLGGWMFGMNTFYDYDWTGDNRRMSMGLEAWRDYLKLSANNYFRLSDWHESRDLVDYNERPANGFDLRAEAYLPAYPQLGGKLVYEKYRGNLVALFGKDNLQKNPYAVTLGLNYTPVNLVTLGADYRQGKGSVNDTTINLQLNYRLGDSWQSQIDPAAVAATRTLAGTRYDLVDRNNDIVLEYQKQQVIKLRLPEQLTGHASDNTTITAQVTSKYAVDRIVWDAAAFTAAGGSVNQVGQDILAITLPPYKVNGGSANIYEISAVAYDIKGNSSNRATTRIEVLPAEAEITAANLQLFNSPAIANGIDIINVRALVTDSAGNPVAGQTVTFSANNNATLITVIGITGADGLATATMTSFTAGTSVVTATLNGNSRTVNAVFTADSATARIIAGNLTIIEDRAFANGSSVNEVQAIVTDAHGNLLAGQQVTFTATNGAVVTTVIGTTGPDGVARATLTNTTSGASIVTAELVSNASSQQVTVTFLPDANSARIAAGDLEIIRDNALADNIATNEVRAKVTDANGNVVPGQTVTFTFSNGATPVTVNGVTDENGYATVTFKNTRAGTTVATAELTNRSTQSVNTTFLANPATATITLLAIDGPDNVFANGTASIRVVATVADAFGNPLQNQTVAFTTSNATAILTPLNSGLTDADGHAVVTLTNTEPGTSPVTATLALNGSVRTVDTHFVLDTTTARIVLMQVTTDGSPADGATPNTIRVQVQNALGQNLPSFPVHFIASNSASPATITLLTDSFGGVTLNLISSTPGTSTVIATLDNGSTETRPVNFIPDSFIDSITVTENNATANGSEENVAVVHVVNSRGGAVNGAAVTLAPVGAAGTFTITSPPAGSRTTDPSGNITFRYTYTLAGALPLQATVDALNSATNADSRFTIPTIGIGMRNTLAPANGTTQIIGDITITTARGNTLPNTRLQIEVEKLTGATLAPFPSTPVPATGSTNLGGTLSVTATSTTGSAGRNLYYIVTMLDVNEGLGVDNSSYLDVADAFQFL